MNTPTTRDEILLAALQRADHGREATGCWASLTDLIAYAIEAAAPDLPAAQRDALTQAIDALALDASGEEALVVPGYDDPRGLTAEPTPIEQWLAANPRYEAQEVLIPEQCALVWDTELESMWHVSLEEDGTPDIVPSE